DRSRAARRFHARARPGARGHAGRGHAGRRRPQLLGRRHLPARLPGAGAARLGGGAARGWRRPRAPGAARRPRRRLGGVRGRVASARAGGRPRRRVAALHRRLELGERGAIPAAARGEPAAPARPARLVGIGARLGDLGLPALARLVPGEDDAAQPRPGDRRRRPGPPGRHRGRCPGRAALQPGV
ncbi:MAG: hypothetical protein AVDCRST_MAG08-2352, partial [uncultured Acetobacteraceae bacterium]